MTSPVPPVLFRRMARDCCAVAAAVAALLASGVPARSIDINDKLSVNGTLASGLQCFRLTSGDDILQEEIGFRNPCRGALPFQPEVSFRPNDKNEFAFKLGFASKNGLNPISLFALAPWAADLEDDVKDINGRGRDHLLTASYTRTIDLGDDNSVAVTAGIIESTSFLDDNAFANDEYGQFMNEAFVNAPAAILPIYDVGAAIEVDVDKVSLRGVIMEVGENADGNEFTFYGGQLGYTVESEIGEGTYRVIVAGTSEDFLGPDGASEQQRAQLIFSFDQELGETLGVFLRASWQNDAAAVTYAALYSGGINIRGTNWGRKDDNIGIAYAFLSRGNLDVGSSHVAEAYYRFAANDNLALTLDAQYTFDDNVGTDDIEGFTFGFRSAAEF